MSRYIYASVSIVAAVALFVGAGVFLPVSNGDDGARRRHGPEFTERSIHGSWGYAGNFAMVVPPAVPEPVPSAAMGTLYFDGKGGCYVTTTINIGGTIFGPADSDTCTYKVNKDGTGTSVAEFPSAPPPFDGSATVAFVIVDKRKEIRFINTNFVVGGFVAKRQ